MGIPLDRNRRFPPHPSDEILEDYALHRLPEAVTAPVEEHLLICATCQHTVAETDQFVAALKGAAGQPAPWWSVLPGLPTLANRTSLAPIVALVLLALVVVWKHPQEASAAVAVSLSSLRGPSPLAPAPAGKHLRLNVDLPDLVSTGEYYIEVVDAAGIPVWKGALAEIDGKLATTMSEPLGPGVYWVRLYGRDSELLREFGLSAK